MKYLSGSELVGYIKVRQAKQVRALRQAHKVFPRLAIIQTIDDPVIDTYVRLKQRYGDDILVDVDRHFVDQAAVTTRIQQLNLDQTVHAIIVQLPLHDPTQTDAILNTVAPHKDVDGLSQATRYDPATAVAINWLCAGYGIDLASQQILIIGQGRLVGAPLARMWQQSGYMVTTIEKTDQATLTAACHKASLLVSGAGVPGLLTSSMIRPDSIVIDAGTASDSGKIVGDVGLDVYERQDLVVTPQKGGVGPLTVAALFDNVIRAAASHLASNEM